MVVYLNMVSTQDWEKRGKGEDIEDKDMILQNRLH